MRIALCLSGHAREFEQVYPFIQKALISKQTDVFISTYDTPGYWSSDDNNPIKTIGKEVTLQRLKSLYNPVRISIDAYTPELERMLLDEAEAAVPNPRMRWGRKQNIMGMFWKIYQCNQLKQDYEEEHGFRYDIVIRCRLDLAIADPVNLLDPEPLTVYLHRKDGLLSDYFFYGNSETMDIICGVYLFMKEIYDSDEKSLFDPHYLLEQSLTYFGLSHKLINISSYILNTPKGYCREQKVALCLYGQPRYLYKGHEYLSKFVLSKYKPDVFIHTWDVKGVYETSPWRPNTSKIYSVQEVRDLYKPIKMVSEEPYKMTVPIDSPSYQGSPSEIQNNCHNILSQIHSRQMVANLLESHPENYDIVIVCRFDNLILSLPDKLDPSHIYFSDTHPGRPVFNDNLMIASRENAIKIMGMEKRLNESLYKTPSIKFNIEELLYESITAHGLLDKCVKTPSLQLGHITSD